MFARIQTLHQPAEKLDELTNVVRKQLPAAHELPGFKASTTSPTATTKRP